MSRERQRLIRDAMKGLNPDQREKVETAVAYFMRAKGDNDDMGDDIAQREEDPKGFYEGIRTDAAVALALGKIFEGIHPDLMPAVTEAKSTPKKTVLLNLITATARAVGIKSNRM